MRIACRLICQITEQGKTPFDIALYDAHHYAGQKGFKIEYKLKIIRVTESGDDAETLKETDWFQKETNLRSEITRNIHFADTTFSYLEKQDQIFIQRDFDII